MKRGGRIFEKTRVEKIEDAEVCRVTTETATATARSVVIATNYPVHDPSFFFARLDQHRSYALALRTDEIVEDNMFIGAGDSEITIRTQYVDGKQLILVGGEMHPTASTSASDQKYHQLEEKTRKLLAVRSIDYHWSAQDSSPLDRVPLIGRMPSQKHVYVATGFGEWGMTNGIVSGKMLSDMILRSSSPWEKLYDPSRLNLKAAIGQLPEMGKQVFKGFGRYMASGSTGPETLKPGEGTIINRHGKKLAVSRLENGTLCALSAVCTHLGCLVDWNTAKRTWDCPCHGSRFAATGEVIHGPAVKPLKQEEVTE